MKRWQAMLIAVLVIAGLYWLFTAGWLVVGCLIYGPSECP
jgi:uncharacterized RDD family membrane protein YckC